MTPALSPASVLPERYPGAPIRDQNHRFELQALQVRGRSDLLLRPVHVRSAPVEFSSAKISRRTRPILTCCAPIGPATERRGGARCTAPCKELPSDATHQQRIYI